MKFRDKLLKHVLIIVVLFSFKKGITQACITLGQTPSTAFPVCGTTIFKQTTVPLCINNQQLSVPGCNPGYPDRNPFYYKFTCYVSGTLGFTINPLASNEDYDWQLFDITGRNPNDIYSISSLVVAANWSGTYGATGASSTGINGIQCASIPSDNTPSFAIMPTLIQGHEYLLLVSHFTDTQSGYDLSFGGGTAVITDPKIPHLATVKPDCNGTTLVLKLNKKVKCNSITATGSEFSILPAVTTVVSAFTDSCSLGFDFDEVTITLASPLPNGNYQLIINNGSDNNTLADNCGNLIPQAESIPFFYAIPQPIFADSIGTPGCAPDSVKVYFPKKIICNTIASNGSDFSVNGPVPVTVTGASGNCVNNMTDYIVVKFSSPVYTKGLYQLTLKAGDDGSVVLDECGQETPTQVLTFAAADTVNAGFSFNGAYGCLRDTLTFFHNGAHDVNSWNWIINNGPPVTTQSYTVVFPAISNNTIQLTVSNGVCTDSAATTVELNNEVKASFTISDSILCPEDRLTVTNSSTGLIDSWTWNYDWVGSSNLKDPPPFLFPTLNREAYYTVYLVVRNNTLNCSDSAKQRVTVLDHCRIDVPTAFTPNNDGLNDEFGPHNALKADSYDFKIFNRWGQLLFHSTNWREKWDGKIKGIVQTTGVYVWMLRYINRETQQPVFRKGTVTVIR